MMTRNDFELLARHLKAMNPGIRGDRKRLKEVVHDNQDLENEAYAEGYRACINQVMGACSAVNARFDRKIFLKACGVTTP